MSSPLIRLLERPLPIGVPFLALGVGVIALCPPAVRLALLALSALGSLAFAMTQFWFERRPRWMRGVRFDRTARVSWWALMLFALLTAVLCRHASGLLAGFTDAAVICGLPLLSCFYALSLQGHTRLS